MSRRTVYSEKILDHYRHPRNFGTLKKPAVQTEAANANCGDEIRLSLEINRGLITEIRFTGSGCVLAIASASLLTESLKGRPIEFAERISASKILRSFPARVGKARQRCVLLARDALAKALGRI